MYVRFHTSLPAEYDEAEPDVYVVARWYQEERRTRDYPGTPAHMEIEQVLLGGQVVTQLPWWIEDALAVEAMMQLE